VHVTNVTMVYRCYDCKRIITDTEIAELGCCPSCGCRRIRGTTPTKWETIKLFFRLLFKKG